MNLRITTRRALRTLTLPVATVVGLSACGDDSSPSNTSDTLADTSPGDVADTMPSDSAEPNDTTDSSQPNDTAEDTNAPSDVADTDSPDLSDTTDTTEDTAQDTNPGDIVTPPSSKVALVAWNGLSTNSPARGSIHVTTSTGSAFGPFATWKSGTNESPIVFGSTANLIGDIDGDGLADLVAWNGLSTNSPARGSINVMLSSGAAFGDSTTWKTGTEQAPVVFGSTANLIGDVDGDGDDDLVAWNGLSTNSPARGSIQVMLSSGAAFGDASTWFNGTNENGTLFGTTANLIADVNGDGRADLIAWNGLSTNSPARGSISVFLSTGTGFAAPTTWFTGTNESPTLFGTTANLAGASAE